MVNVTAGQQAAIVLAHQAHLAVVNRNTNAFLFAVHTALGLQKVGSYSELSFSPLQRSALLNAAEKYQRTGDSNTFTAEVQAAVNVQPSIDVAHGADARLFAR